MVGKILEGRYEILDRIGTGGMSLVYRARDLSLSRLVAVKILKHQWAEDEEVVRRFKQEARASASLVNRHVVQVFDVGAEVPDIHFMVMELVAGETLREKIDKDAPLPVEKALDIADQVLLGIEAAHAKKLIHRDIKPQNILISEDDDIVKVADFGIAYAATSGTLVNTGSMFGTVQYLSPEQARGKLIGPQTDLYSMGVVLFEMLTGRLPFEGESAIGVAIKHLQDEAPTVQSLRPDVPDAVNVIVERALAKDPADRYQTAHGMRQDIARVLNREISPLPTANGGGVPATVPAGASENPVPKSKFKKWRPWLIALLALIVLIGGGIFAFYQWLNVPVVALPNVKGHSLTTARSQLGKEGLKIQIIGRAPSSVLPKNYIYNEIPQPGTPVKAGQTIQLVLSSGPTIVSVPNVKGQDVFQAKQSLKTVGFKVKDIVTKSHMPKGQVVRQSPVAGASKPQGSIVKLWVSKGPAVHSQTMPNLGGLSVSQAASELIGLNMSVGTPTMQWSTQTANTIIDQHPTPYKKISGASTVNVTVSNGPSPASSSLPKNITIASWQIPSSAPPRSVLKVVVTDSAHNEEVFYQEVNPGNPVDIPVTWYGKSGQLVIYLNGQPSAPQALTPNYGTATPTSPSGSVGG